MSLQISPALAARGLRPAAELARDKPHGVRLRYMAGCRCFHCRRANTAYEKERAALRKAGLHNGMVSAAAARAHLLALSAIGIGRRTVHDVSGLSETVLCDIRTGSKLNIRASTERAILAVTQQAALDGCYVDATLTWQLIDELRNWGYSKAFLALQLGAKTPKLQINKHSIRAGKARDVQRLHERLRHVAAAPTQALLHELSEEGYHRKRVAQHLAALAAELHVDAPDLTVRRGFIRSSAADLVARLHERLTA